MTRPPAVLMAGCALADVAGLTVAVHTGRWGFALTHVAGTAAIAALALYTRLTRQGRP